MGGLGKGHLMREIDALDGLIARLSDKAAIQYRLLNRSKGPAVRGPRAQIDRALYRAAMQHEIASTPNLTVVEAGVAGFVLEGGRVAGVTMKMVLSCGLLVLCSRQEPFLGGLIHIGDKRIPAGRVGEAPSNGLADVLRGTGLQIGRLKTGTPPRLDATQFSMWGSKLNRPMRAPFYFSTLTDRTHAQQIACHITYTNEVTHQIIEENLSAIRHVCGAYIEGTGPVTVRPSRTRSSNLQIAMLTRCSWSLKD
jgi:tRNA uridine 5-carboxymethylaminomethyl modification enzyme